MPQTILLVEPMLDQIEARLDADFEVLRLYDPHAQEAVNARLTDIRAVVTGGGTGLSREWFDKLPNLGLVAINGVGTDKVDLDLAAARNVHVSTTPDVLTDDVADIGMGLIIATLRQFGTGERLVRQGRWAAGTRLALGQSLRGKRLGVVGLGQIGAALASRATAFGMQIGYFNRSPRQIEQNWERFASPGELAGWSDVLAICVAGVSQTASMIDAHVLAALGPEGFLVNIARGSIIDENALLTALENRTIAGAGLDVFLNEPKIDPRFAALDNVVLLPHQGSATVQTRMAMGQLVLDNLSAFFAGRTPPTSVVPLSGRGQ
ncbi:2-hydroxyacid dehydrogenase [Devosia sp.]|uniref:2-hydroxyacid dehydrogenase n=1 Tax=Devosia sp. TaxID=1871048 RepID=UPI0027341438|nr:2-hydroxyacid dehydrogenase [Devosia sp.]MDP2778885.1 2-hydroxyacid dehydrogenase [Devosia sp.]